MTSGRENQPFFSPILVLCAFESGSREEIRKVVLDLVKRRVALIKQTCRHIDQRHIHIAANALQELTGTD